jgi:hypothetical protein
MTNAKVSMALGFLLLFAGVAWLILRWDSIVRIPLTGAPFPTFLILLGMEVVYFSYKKWRKPLALGNGSDSLDQPSLSE